MSRQNKPIYRLHRNDPPRTRGFPGGFRDTAYARLSRHLGEEYIEDNQIRILPATARSFFEEQLQPFVWKGALEVIFAGTRDEESPLALLQKHESTLVRDIFSYISNQWAEHVKLTLPASLVGRTSDDSLMKFQTGRSRENRNCFNRTLLAKYSGKSNGFENGFVSFAKCGRVEFPEPANRNVNMMPFIFGDIKSLPDDLQCYFPLIEQCPYMADERGKVGYLTVHESYIDVGQTQRREGLHIESPGFFNDDPNAASFTPGVEHPWGMGVFFGPDRYEGGIFMASSVADTSEVWDALVDNRVPGIVDKHGGCEHLRALCGPGTKLEAGELIWMTDCTPHEALPQNESGLRQFFRVVTPYVSHWYADHSTANPKVPLLDHVRVMKGSKFKNARLGEQEG